MGGNKQKSNNKQLKTTRKSKNANKGKLAVIISTCAAIVVIVAVSAIIIVLKANNAVDFSEYANYPSSFPDYFSNLQEEKESFARALSTCNKAAETKLAAKGIKTEYRETDIDVINKWAGFNSRINAPYIEIGVEPTGGDTEYKDYGLRTYHCYANISGTSVYELSITWDEKN